MKWIYRLERKLGRSFGIPNLMIYITATQLAVYIMYYFFMPDLVYWISLLRPLVLQGEIWRLITFIFVPPVLDGNILMLILSLFVAYNIGSSLEHEWGTMLFTLYYTLGTVGAIAAGMISGIGYNYYIYLSMFLAYAYLYPNATFMLFFLLPVKAKWLAALDWALYIYLFIVGGAAERFAIVFSLINFFVFFGPDVWRTMKQNYKTSKRRREFRKNWGNDNPWR